MHTSEHKNLPIRIPVFNAAVFRTGEKIMSIVLETQNSNTVLMANKRAVTITKIQAPNFNCFICRSTYQKFSITTYINSENWQLVAVQIQQQLHCVYIAHFQSGVQQTEHKELAI